MNIIKNEDLKLGYNYNVKLMFPFSLCFSRDVIHDLMDRDIDGLFFLGNDVLTEYDEYPTLKVWKYGRVVAIRDSNRKVMPDEFVDVMFFVC